MKKLPIIAMACIAIAVAVFVSAADDMSTYATFAEAAATEQTVRVVGALVKDRPVDFDPLVNANAFSFYVADTDGAERKVTLMAAKPQDFELSEQIVVTGQMRGEEFVATDMLMKCPSKYKDEEIYIKGNS